MDAAVSFVALKRCLDVHGLTYPGMKEWPGTAPGKEWSIVNCARKMAYGCGKHGQKMVEGLSLYIRRPDLTSAMPISMSDTRRFNHPDLTSALCIGLSEEGIQSIEAELGVSGRLEVQGEVRIAHQQILVLFVTFLYRHVTERLYYLVFDSTDASLYMIPYIPGDVEAMYTLTPVPERAADGRGHRLALLARNRLPYRRIRHDPDRGRLCLCTPASRLDPAPDSTGPWEMKMQWFPELPDAFSADVVFSIEGKVFWADLSQGIAYSDLCTEDSAVKTYSVLLPTELQIQYPDWDYYNSYEKRAPVKSATVTRTMGSVEGSIKFVCIDVCGPCPGNWMVKVLTLDLDNQQWEEEKGFPCPWIDLWKQVGLMNAEPLEPQYPVLMPNGDICLLLHDKQGPKEAEYICRFDMRTKSLQSLGTVQNYVANAVVIVPFDLFTSADQAGNCRPRVSKVREGWMARDLAETSRDSSCASSTGSTLRLGDRVSSVKACFEALK